MSHRPKGVGEAIVRDLRAGMSYTAIARDHDCATATVAYHARKHNLLRGRPDAPPSPSRADVNWRAVQEYYDAGHGVRACGIRFGFTNGSWTTAVKHGDVIPRPPNARKPLDAYLVSNSTLYHRTRLRLIDAEGGRCALCGLTDWLGQPLSLDVHHRNGDHRDNRRENLQVLCPNCHRQQGPLV